MRARSLPAPSQRPIRVYVAGKMTWLNSEDSAWEASLPIMNPSIREALRRLSAVYNVKFVFPDEVTFNHGGDMIQGIVAKDLAALGKCDAILAVFTHEVQVGTIVELLHAVHSGKYALALFHRKLAPIIVQPYGDMRGGFFLSGPVLMRGDSDVYWFLINYLLGDESRDGVVHKPSFRDRVKVGVFETEQDMLRLIQEWLAELRRRIR